MPSLLPVYKRAPVEFERGEGPYLFDRDGRRYLDFGTGIAVTLLGHSHPHLVAALKEQGEKFWHCSNLYGVEPQQKLADRLVANSFADTVFFCNSGAEALECAIKMARSHFYHRGQPDRHRIITFEGAFHGRTIATITAGGQDKYLEGYRPGLPGFDHLPLGDLDRVLGAIGDQTAAILIEPIQGEGGIRRPQAAFLEGLRRICDERDLLLILDEVQTGVGRTGRFLAQEHAGVEADVTTLGKGLGAGVPVSAVVLRRRATCFEPGDHGSTFGGNPLMAAVALRVTDKVKAPAFLARVREAGARLEQALGRLAVRFGGASTRGQGLLQALVFDRPLAERARDAGLLVNAARPDVLRFMPQLEVSDDEIDEMTRRLAHAHGSL
jgi:acetylornithine/N-succinyldiaminopimelate aminotransferase